MKIKICFVLKDNDKALQETRELRTNKTCFDSINTVRRIVNAQMRWTKDVAIKIVNIMAAWMIYIEIS